MGVTKLWDVLSEVGELQHLYDMVGSTLAVDLSAWICQARGAAMLHKNSPDLFIYRTIFFRTVELLKIGVKLVFVLDGQAPALKKQTLIKRYSTNKKSVPWPESKSSIGRPWYKQLVGKVVDMLKYLGTPVIQSPGEAEKMCAYLNSTQAVVGIITDDSDAFLYGARKVLRKYDHKDMTATKVEMNKIEEKLNLGRRDLIAFALLSGCDYDSTGVKGVGPDQIQALFKEMKEHEEDILNRILTWKENKDLASLARTSIELKEMKKSSHCSTCEHTGSQNIHQSRGCKQCSTKTECNVDNKRACDCRWHELKRLITPYSLELKLRDKALTIEVFTERSQQIIEEFTSFNLEAKQVKQTPILYSQIDLIRLCDCMKTSCGMQQEKVVEKIVPFLANSKLRGEYDGGRFKPKSIRKVCRRKRIRCFETIWSKLDKDIWTTCGTYTVLLEQELFKNKYPELVASFEAASAKSSKKRKTPATPKNQRKVTGMIKANGSKRKGPIREEERTPGKSSSKVGQVRSCKRSLNFMEQSPKEGAIARDNYSDKSLSKDSKYPDTSETNEQGTSKISFADPEESMGTEEHSEDMETGIVIDSESEDSSNSGSASSDVSVFSVDSDSDEQTYHHQRGNGDFESRKRKLDTSNSDTSSPKSGNSLKQQECSSEPKTKAMKSLEANSRQKEGIHKANKVQSTLKSFFKIKTSARNVTK